MSDLCQFTSIYEKGGSVTVSFDDLPVRRSTIVTLPDTQIHSTDETLVHGLSLCGQDKYTSVPSEPPLVSTLSFHNIDYIVGAKRQNLPCKKWVPSCIKPKQSRQILYDVSGMFKSGLNAVMGPTGCGKSSLLDILADRKHPRGLSGRILLDGKPRDLSFKYTVGYVVQEDIITGTLTVRENLMFSANVRLPKDVSKNERAERVTKVINELGLESCADTRIGTEFLRGVSGGERRRTCIGMELVLSPKILFLDEPTTGLDSSTARNVIERLSFLSKQGRTIIFSIHQPRYSIFKLFDTILLMCKGKSIYHGPTDGVLSYFTNQGYHCELHENPADFALDILIEANHKSEELEKLYQAYLQSPMHMSMTLIPERHSSVGSVEIWRRIRQGSATHSLSTEFFYVSQRTLRNTLRNPALFLSQIVVAILLGLLVGLVFYDMELTTDSGVQNRLGAIFFIVVSQIFSTLTAIEPLIKERVLFIHEYVSGYYRTSTFFLSKLICDLLPMRVVPSIVFSLIAYFLTGFQRSAGQFLIFFITVFMGSVFGLAMCFFIAATISVFSVAVIVAVLIFVVMLVFTGFIVDLNSIFNWLSWIQWISAFRYSSNVLTVNEFRNMIFCQPNATNNCGSLVKGTSILDERDLDYANNWDMWKYFFALTMMTIAFLLLAYIQLVRIKKTK